MEREIRLARRVKIYTNRIKGETGMESLGRPPSYTVQKERLGNHKKFWTVRCRGKFITAFGTKGDAQGWIYSHDQRRRW